MVLENSVEAWVIRLAEERGGRALKLTGYKGIPDRLVILPGGVMFFVETKRPKGGVVAKAQEIWAKVLRRMGFEVFIPRNREEVHAIFEGL